MKGIAFFFVSLVVGSFANPALPLSFNEEDPRIVTGQIVQIIEDLSQTIRDRGFDPYERTAEGSYELPVPVLFSAQGFVNDFIFTGISDINVVQINYSIIQSRLTFIIVLPRVGITIDSSAGKVVLFGEEYTASLSGSVVVNEIRVQGNIRVSIGISGVSVRDISLQFSIANIASNVNAELFGRDISRRINTLIGVTIPFKLYEFRAEINELLEIIVLQLINDNLNSLAFMY